jgi:hypothetical protein
VKKYCRNKICTFSQLQSANKSSKSNRNCKKAVVEDEKSKQVTENDTLPQTSSTKEDGPFADTDFVSTTVNQLLSLTSEIGLYIFSFLFSSSDWIVTKISRTLLAEFDRKRGITTVP